MKNNHFVLLSFIIVTFFSACGGGEDDSSQTPTMQQQEDTIYSLSYKGLPFFKKNMPSSSYKLSSLSDSEFNELNTSSQFMIADKLLSTLFYAYPMKDLKLKIESGNFISEVEKSLALTSSTKAWLEAEILNEDKYRRYSSGEQEAVDILARFYAAKELDSYFFHNWVAYILTQTILFSPAYEIDSSHSPNISRVYNRIVRMLEDEAGMRYITYMHMISDDNWRRFRSPEDNGREMLEIFTLDMNDAHVPIAGQALKNWKLDRNSDTLVIGLNENREKLTLFNTTIKNGDDFYRELAKSDAFSYGVTERLVAFFFTDYSHVEVQRVSQTILASQPETFQDILKQIVFSKEYLLKSSRAKSAEELFYSLAKKMDYKHMWTTFRSFKSNLEKMNQASMKYILGKLTRTPLDTLSFANYHKTIREQTLLRRSNPEYAQDYTHWSRQGWSDSFIDNTNFEYNKLEEERSLESLINHIFMSMIAREANTQEMVMFKGHMLESRDARKMLTNPFRMFRESYSSQRREGAKRNITQVVLEYISRLDVLYMQRKVN